MQAKRSKAGFNSHDTEEILPYDMNCKVKGFFITCFFLMPEP